jgi:transposase InsO family protein
MFAMYGFPYSIVSDNGKMFTIELFAKFSKEQLIHHIHSAPRHPSGNKLAERVIPVFKTSCVK